ncbi:hypothetical protein PYCCODRAFT_1403106 [Trametes coccinea BRFM310]|uniref:WD40 repeat-like protein n=1 Tax=Trametes coccinea (strain BRFM310) TaxID=1353009 RepID=A0A1Y2J4U5_TRAC3|nr:hypothetical protein PYCCODRAFT_1403106 [Trametes coccinea BRFM310]
MPRDLPGMYWDEEKRRYFPLSSRPAGTPAAAPALRPTLSKERAAEPSPRISRKRRLQQRDLYSPPPSGTYLEHGFKRLNGLYALNAFRESTVNPRSRRYRHDIQMSHLSTAVESHLSDSGPLPLNFGESITALCAKSKVDAEGGNLWIGDRAGWLHTMNTSIPDHSWREFTLGTEITSITSSGPITLATSLGSPARVLVKREQTLGHWLLRELPVNMCNDVRCGQVSDNTVVVGGRNGAVCFMDAERDEYLRLRCNSDVFSLASQDRHLLYLGLRSGVIERWDLRQPHPGPDVMVNMTAKSKLRGGAPVQHLRTIHGYGLLVETMRGDLEVHDLRYRKGETPLLQLPGHVSSYEHKLGLAIDSHENFVFAGGGDSRLRAWSLRTGQALHSETDATVVPQHSKAGPFQQKYPHPMSALELITDEEKTYLWMASDKYLHKVELGPRGILC